MFAQDKLLIYACLRNARLHAHTHLLETDLHLVTRSQNSIPGKARNHKKRYYLTATERPKPRPENVQRDKDEVKRKENKLTLKCGAYG